MSDTGDQTEAELERTREVVAATVAEQSDAADAALLEPDEPAAEEGAEEGWDAYTKDELAAELGNRGLAVSGSKAELVARLEEDDA